MFEKLKIIWAQLTAEQKDQNKAACPDNNDRAVEHIQPPKVTPVVESPSKLLSPESVAHHPEKKRKGKSAGKAVGQRRGGHLGDTGSEFSTLFEGGKQESFAETFVENLEIDDIIAVVKEKGDLAEPVSSSVKSSLAQMELDLHGCTSDQAEVKIESFIQRALYQGAATVRIITGKGLHSSGPAVLPDVAKEKLSQLQTMNKVKSFSWEGGIRGALIVRL